MKVIVGLGNPGPRYAHTRHNVGFMVVERLGGRHGLHDCRQRFHAAVVDGVVAGQRCLLVRPLTYMNNSGLAVGEVVRFHRVDPAVDLLVIVDDVALPLGRIRLRPEGGAGGHNGLADIERALGGNRYPRLRVGIDSPGPVPQADYVLGCFDPRSQAGLADLLELACDAADCWLAEGLEQAMTRYNRRPD